MFWEIWPIWGKFLTFLLGEIFIQKSESTADRLTGGRRRQGLRSPDN